METIKELNNGDTLGFMDSNGYKINFQFENGLFYEVECECNFFEEYVKIMRTGKVFTPKQLKEFIDNLK